MSTRLPGAKYKGVFDRGRSLKGRLLVGWACESPGVESAAGVVVSKKTFRHAVDRNRAKRLTREAFRLLAKDGAMPEETEWVFIARRQIAGKKVADVMAEMKRIVRAQLEHLDSGARPR